MTASNRNKASILVPFPYPHGLNHVISELDLQALADGALDEEERRAVMAAVLEDPLLLARLDELITQRNLLRDAWQPGEDPSDN